jgi:hypothetical protein
MEQASSDPTFSLARLRNHIRYLFVLRVITVRIEFFSRQRLIRHFCRSRMWLKNNAIVSRKLDAS